MIVGYARVSTEEQKVDLQRAALRKAGCKNIYEDHGTSGSIFVREGLDAALANLKPGGTLVVWRLDRLGRSLSGLVNFIELLGARQVHFRSLTENIDTTSSGGRLMFHMMAALAEFERTLISERTRAGIEEARAQGRRIGRPKTLNQAAIREALSEVEVNGMTMQQVASKLGVSPRTLRRYFERARSAVKRE
jgi:DNA invertase Pin-like site-specific DNA recombinase